MKEEEEKTEPSSSSDDDGPPLTPWSAEEIVDMPYSSLTERKEQITARLKVVGVSSKAPANSKFKSESSAIIIPHAYNKTDTHWDFLLKEMMWLAADFSAERKRQLATGKKVAGAVKQFHKTKETRRVRELAEAELKRRRLAGKIGREVKGWWTKIERVIAYKQKVDGDKERRKAMNKQLVALVNQTERYGESLATAQYENDEDMLSDASYDSENGNQRKRRRKRRLTIEEALAEGNESLARRASVMTDYARLDKQQEADDFYGETTTSDSGSDGSFVLETYSTDDETTLLEAEATELAERRAQVESDDDDNVSYYADPDELRKLQEEADMDVADVVERFRQEKVEVPEHDMQEQDLSDGVTTRRVRFARSVDSSNGVAMNGNHEASKVIATRSTRKRGAQMPAADPGHEADDDADASDVEDFARDDTSDSDGSDEFEADNDEMDDETTIAAEERLGREMSADEEIRLLKEENEMTIDDLRKRYSSGEAANDVKESQSELSAQDTLSSGVATRTHSREDGNGSIEKTVFEGESGQEVASSSGVATRTRSREDEQDLIEETVFDADDGGESDEFRPDDVMEVDDETTIEAEERRGREMSYEEEMSLLQQEGEIPIEQLRAIYAGMEEDSDDLVSDESETQSQSSVGNGQSLREMLEHGESDEGDEFRPDAAEFDDETTMEADERLGRDMSFEAEINLLKRESEMPVEELRRMYSGMGAENGDDDSHSLDESIFDEDDHESEDEFRPAVEAVDDETTIEAEERLGLEISVEDEIAILQRESATPVEDLRAMYKQMEEADTSSDQDMSVDNDDAQKGQQGRKRSRPDSDLDDDDGEAALKALKIAEDRARMTRATRPFLIAPWVKLREYQQIGLNWLVSIQSRRLNGILAGKLHSTLIGGKLQWPKLTQVFRMTR